MAAICPNCHLPEMVAYIVNDEGTHPLPCLNEVCGVIVARSTPYGHLMGSAPCATSDCQGSVRDEYRYDANGRLSRLDRVRCQLCGTDKTEVIKHAGSTPERPLPDPRMPGIAGRRVPHG